MRLTRKSVVLLLGTLLLAVFNVLAAQGGHGPTAAELPALADVSYDDVRKITVSTQIDKLVIERQNKDDAWAITAPIQYRADETAVKAFIKGLSGGVRMDTLVDEGNLEDYGVDDQHGVLAEVWTDADVPVIGVMVGRTAGNNSAFVRLPGASTVYRADIGARARYDRPAASWREKVALDAERADVATLRIERGTETLLFTRGSSSDPKVPGTFTLAGAPFPIDTESVEVIVKSLAHLRAGEIHNPDYEAGMNTPVAVATLGMKDGSTHRVVMGAKADENAAFVRVDDAAVIFRVSAQLRARLLLPLTDLRDRTMLHFAVDQVQTLTWNEGGITVALAQAEPGKWTVTQPANMDADQRQVTFVVSALAELRGSAFAADDAFAPSGVRLTIRLKEGEPLVVELGQKEKSSDGRALTRLRASGRSGIFLLPDEAIAEIRRAFGRG